MNIMKSKNNAMFLDMEEVGLCNINRFLGEREDSRCQ